MTRVYVGVGSNIDRKKNICNGIAALEKRLGKLIVSPVYQCSAYGFDGDDFYNLVVGFDTDYGVDAIIGLLHDIEFYFGRKRDEARFSSRTLDLDLLLYGDLQSEDRAIPRGDITHYAFVLKPLTDIAPGLILPGTDKTMNTLWLQFDQSACDLIEIKLKPSGAMIDVSTNP